MPKRPKVVPIDQKSNQPRVIAADYEAHRLIFAIGKRRFTFDIRVSATVLPSDAGDRQASLIPMKLRGK
jgi:hypothetical protein